MKTTLNKFELPVASEEKLELIEDRFGAVGFAVIVKLLMRIFGTCGYYCTWNNSFVRILSARFGVETKLLGDIVAYAISIGFFDGHIFLDKSVLTSADIQEQYFRSVSSRSGVTYDPDLVIGDLHTLCKRAIPFPTGTLSVPDETPSDGLSENSGATVEAEARVEAPQVTAPTEETAAAEGAASSDATDRAVDTILELQYRRMLGKGKTVPLAQLIDVTGADTLVPPEVIGDDEPSVDRAISEVFSPIEKGSDAPAPDGFVSVGGASSEALARGDEECERDQFVRDRKKPRCDKVYGRYFNVLLDDDEYSDLAARIPNVDDYIQRLSRKLLDKDFICKNAYEAIVDCHERAMARTGGTLCG